MNPSLRSYIPVDFEQLTIISKNAKIFVYRENGDDLNLWRVSEKILWWRQICTPRDTPIRRHPTDKIFKSFEMTLWKDWPVSKRRIILTAAHLANEIGVLETVLEKPHIG